MRRLPGTWRAGFHPGRSEADVEIVPYLFPWERHPVGAKDRPNGDFFTPSHGKRRARKRDRLLCHHDSPVLAYRYAPFSARRRRISTPDRSAGRTPVAAETAAAMPAAWPTVQAGGIGRMLLWMA